MTLKDLKAWAAKQDHDHLQELVQRATGWFYIDHSKQDLLEEVLALRDNGVKGITQMSKAELVAELWEFCEANDGELSAPDDIAALLDKYLGDSDGEEEDD